MELFVSFIYKRNSVINRLKVGEKTKLSILVYCGRKKRKDEGRPVPIVLGNLGAAFAVGSNFLWF